MYNVTKLIAALSHFVNKKVIFVECTIKDDKIRYLVYDPVTNILYFTDSAKDLLYKEDINASECDIYNIEDD